MELLLNSETTKIIGGQTCSCFTRSFYVYFSASHEFSSLAGINDFLKRTITSTHEEPTSTSREISESACKIKCCSPGRTYHSIKYGTQTLTMYRYEDSANIFNLSKHCN